MILYIVHKEIAIGRLSIVLDWRSKKSFMGRFGYRAKETESPA